MLSAVPSVVHLTFVSASVVPEPSAISAPSVNVSVSETESVPAPSSVSVPAPRLSVPAVSEPAVSPSEENANFVPSSTENVPAPEIVDAPAIATSPPANASVPVSVVAEPFANVKFAPLATFTVPAISAEA